MKLKGCFTLCLAVSSLVSSSSTWATTIALDFSNLPSAQGWTYLSDGAPETSIFSVSGGVLTMNTLAGPFSFETYNLAGSVDPLLPYSVSIRARVLEESGNFAANSFGFCFDGRLDDVGFAIGIGTSRIQHISNIVLSTSIDNTQFHDYRLEVTPGVGFQFLVDGALVATGPPFLSVGLVNALLFGDCTRGVGTHVEITAFVFRQVTDVSIDIKPGSDPNGLNPRKKGVVPVAILTTSVADGDSVDFDPFDNTDPIDPTTLRFGPDGASIRHAIGHASDVDDDGDLDMVLHFPTQDTGIACGDTEATLTGSTVGGQNIEGTDSVKTSGCK